jgi:hypothetical protein
LIFALIQQAAGHGDCFLFNVENFLEVRLGFGQGVFLGFAGSAELFQRGFDLIGRRIVGDRVAQRFQFGAGLTAESAATATTTTAAATAATTAASSAAAEAGAVPAHSRLSVEHFLNAILDRFPGSVVGHTHFLVDLIHTHLLELGGVKVATATAAVAASAATTTTTTATTAAAAAIALRHRGSDRQAQCRGKSSHE